MDLHPSSSSPPKKIAATSSSSSGEEITISSSKSSASIPVDILLNIFVLLPITIFRMRSVSKLWLSILSEPRFIVDWITVNGKSLPWLVYNAKDDNLLISYPRKFVSAIQNMFLKSKSRPKDLYLIGSSNGLVLGASTDRARDYCVFNPLTEQWVTLPPLTSASGTNMDRTITGFTCELSTSCFKVVRVIRFKTDTKKLRIEIFSSDVGEWTAIDVLLHKDVNRDVSFFGSSVVVNEVLYWIESAKMLAFDLNHTNIETDGRQCMMIDLPVSKKSYDVTYCLGESEGLLFFAAIFRSHKTLSVWVFEETWRLLHKDVELHELVAATYGKFYKYPEYSEEEEDSQAESEYTDRENASIDDVKIVGFNPANKNIILLMYKYVIWAFNLETTRYEELVGHSFKAKKHSGAKKEMTFLSNPFVVKAMPTILPPAPWIKTSGNC